MYSHSPDGSKIYVTSWADYRVYVISTATNTVSDTIAIGTNPEGVSVSPDGSKVYVTDEMTNNISVISTATNTVMDTIAVGKWPEGVSVSPDGSKVYVANSGSNTVSVINTAENSVMATIPVGKSPFSLGNFISIYPSHLGIDSPDIISADIEVYPNPVTDYLTIESPQGEVGSGNKQQAVIEITNIQGQLIKTFTSTGNKTNIDVSAFVKGVYIVRIRTNSGIFNKKVIIE
jgi:YVTN family beta-propeller protein